MEQKMPLLSGSKAVINFEKCKFPDDCLKCAGACKLLKAISRGENGFPVVDVNECFGCGDCAEECPSKAIKILWLEGAQSSESLPKSSKFATW